MNPFLKSLLDALLPLLVKLLQSWLDKALKAAAKKVGDPTGFGSPAAYAVAVVQQAIDDTPKAAFGRRAFLREARQHAGKIVSGFPLDAAAQAELSDAGKGAARD